MADTTHSLKKRLLDFISRPGYQPLKDHDLADELGILTHERNLLRGLLRELADAGLAKKLKGNRWAKSSGEVQNGSALTGTIHVSPQGHGMVRLGGRAGADSEIFIPPGALGGALHGDRVLVEPSPASRRTQKREEATGPDSRRRPIGRVLRVVERKKKILVGLLMKSSAYWYVIPDHPRINQNVRVSGHDRPGGKTPESGHKVVVQLDELVEGELLHGTVIENLGDPSAPGVDVLSILREHSIATGFSPHAEKEARAQMDLLTGMRLEGRLDLRDETIITIDPSDAKDHDDAVSLRALPGDGWILGVHIADVSHFVTPGSAIDRDARAHGNSVYMVDRFIPMLPSFLTSEVCSLKAGRDRFAYSVFITYDRHGEIQLVEMKSSVIHPKILLSYEQVQELIVSGHSRHIPSEYHKLLRELHELASLLRKKRMRHGAVDLAMPEVTCTLDETGRPVSIKRRAAPEAYHLIEECMLAANIAVADRLVEAHVPAIFRIHDEPTAEQWSQMAADLHQLGIHESPSDRHDVQRIARAYLDKPLGYPVSVAILRNFMRAVYSADCSPHFGLAFDRYTHFTSPIRRYSDLVVHRILKSLDEGRGGCYARSDCEDFAEHCSLREREASEAEEESLIIKRIQFYDEQCQRGEVGPWPALITGSTTRGLLVEMTETLQRGFIPSHALPDPNLRFDRESGYITGRKGRQFARIGDVIQVELMRVDRGRRSIEVRWVMEGISAKGKSASQASRHARRQSPPRRGGPA